MIKRLIFTLILCIFLGISFYYLTPKDVKYENDLEKLKYSKGQITPWGQELLGIDNNVGQKVKVAILDSGVNKSHPDLVGKIKEEYNAINIDEPTTDNLGHGTGIAGIIAANDNNEGILGIAPNAEIYSVKVLSDSGKGNVESLIKGIEWCISNHIDIINISFGVESNNSQLEQIVNTAIENNIIIVAAAGNNYLSKVEYPAKYKNVISIGAVDSELKRASFSSKGKVDFSAPGVDILSTNNLGSYELYSGTSFATAYITGTIARILGNKEIYNVPYEDDNLSYIETILKKISKDLGPAGYDMEYGHGIIILNDTKE